MAITKSRRKPVINVDHERERASSVNMEGKRVKPVDSKKILEIAFWGGLIWGLGRIVSNFFNFTPYGIRVFSRPVVGMVGEDTQGGMVIGLVVFLALVILFTVLYSVLFSRFQVWWAGILYGGALFLLFGRLFNMFHWTPDTVSTELGWFVTIGMFIGMTLSAERYSRE